MTRPAEQTASPALARCAWPKSELAVRYHDQEWCVPVHHDPRLFEALVLGGVQAGLSWEIVLRKRARYREVFDRFDPAQVARYDRRKIASLLKDPGIIRNRLKIESAIQNARAFLVVREAWGSFDAYLWRFVGGLPRQNRWRSPQQVPDRTKESDALSKDLKQRGFTFVGSTICYAVMQSVGLCNDHLVGCFRHRELG